MRRGTYANSKVSPNSFEEGSCPVELILPKSVLISTFERVMGNGSRAFCRSSKFSRSCFWKEFSSVGDQEVISSTTRVGWPFTERVLRITNCPDSRRGFHYDRSRRSRGFVLLLSVVAVPRLLNLRRDCCDIDRHYAGLHTSRAVTT
jgi:hypothetical protein